MMENEFVSVKVFDGELTDAPGFGFDGFADRNTFVKKFLMHFINIVRENPNGLRDNIFVFSQEERGLIF
jgi:hypothetical protein